MWFVWFTSASGWVGPFQCPTAGDVFQQLHDHSGREPFLKWHFDQTQNSWVNDGPTVESALAFPLVLENVIYLFSQPTGVSFFIQKG